MDTFIFCSSEGATTGAKNDHIILPDQHQTVGALTEGDESGFCKSITSMTSSASSLILLKPPSRVTKNGM